MKAPKQEIVIPHAIKKLDEILAKCLHRLHNHYNPGEWEKLAESSAGSDTRNPRFKNYISLLKDEGLIIDASREEGEGTRDGCILTTKGELFEGFENKFRREIAERERIVSLETNSETSQNRMVLLTWAIVGVGVFPSLYSLVEIIKFCYSYFCA